MPAAFFREGLLWEEKTAEKLPQSVSVSVRVAIHNSLFRERADNEKNTTKKIYTAQPAKPL